MADFYFCENISCMSLSLRILVLTLLFPFALHAQTHSEAHKWDSLTREIASHPNPTKKGYWSGGTDASLFQSALLKTSMGGETRVAPLRYTLFVNFGYNYNYDFTRHFGFFVGAGLKNVGFIQRYNGDSTVKRRLYSLGVPVGLKFGNLPGRSYFYLGGGADVPLNYREKGFVDRGDKTKFNEWFSDRTPRVMPFLFAGYTFFPGVMTIKAQYYPGNFFNQDFVETRSSLFPSSKPYSTYTANLMYISIGFDIKYGKKKHHDDEDDETPTTTNSTVAL